MAHPETGPKNESSEEVEVYTLQSDQEVEFTFPGKRIVIKAASPLVIPSETTAFGLSKDLRKEIDDFMLAYAGQIRGIPAGERERDELFAAAARQMNDLSTNLNNAGLLFPEEGQELDQGQIVFEQRAKTMFRGAMELPQAEAFGRNLRRHLQDHFHATSIQPPKKAR